MKALVDNGLSPAIAHALRDAGYQATHVREIGIPHAPDQEIIEYASRNEYVILTIDSDFSMLLAIQDRAEPSVLMINGVLANNPRVHARLVIANLPAVADALADGAIVILEPSRVRIRRLPVD